MHPNEVQDSVQKILKDSGRPNKFVDDRPGDKWLKLFLQRHPNISKRNTEIISRTRASVTEKAIREWFHDLEIYLLSENLLDMMSDPSRIFNADETGMRTCMNSGLVLGPAKKFKNLYEVASGNEKESITVLCNYAAEGIAAPPMTVFPYKRIPKELALSVPAGWAIGRSDSGWMTSSTFYEYIANVFYPWLLEKGVQFPVILFIDGHKSHYNVELYEFCLQKKIILYCLFPNSTHILQPCDVSIFRPLKVLWKEACRNYKQQTNANITRHNFCSIFKDAFDKACKPSTIINGFRVCGLYPLNPDAVDYSKCISTRRNEIFQKISDVEVTLDDYKSSLKVLENYLERSKIEEFKKKLDEGDTLSDVDEPMYSYWKHCKAKVIEQNFIENENPNVLQDSNLDDNVNAFSITESLLDQLPIEINGIVYSPLPNFEYETTNNEFEMNEDSASFYNVNESSNNDLNIFAKKTVNGSDLILQSTFTEISKRDFVENTQSKLDCEQLLEIILERVFNEVEAVVNVSRNVVNEDLKMELKSSSEKQIKVISNIVIQNKQAKEKNDEIWKKHLHWPKLEETKKRCSSAPMPYAITSKKWADYQEEQQRKKSEKEDEIRKKN